MFPPTSGRILVDGRVVTAPGPDRAVVFQDAVAAAVAHGAQATSCTASNAATCASREAAERARAFIDLVGLSGFEHNYPHELSGGMQQRVNLARALVMDPQVLLMDEPFAALDAQTREVMQEELLRIWLTARKTVLFITHQIDEAIYLSDRVVVFSARPGRVKDIIDVGIERPRRLGREARAALPCARRPDLEPDRGRREEKDPGGRRRRPRRIGRRESWQPVAFHPHC